MGDLSKNFSLSEFRDRRAGGAVRVHPQLIVVLQRLRDQVEVPIKIRSGYRTVATNMVVGGARNSQHLRGRAADIDCEKIITPQMAKAAGAKGVGISQWDGRKVVHIDVREGSYRQWRY